MATSKSNDSDAFAAALRVLTRQDRSEAELRSKLKQFGFSASVIDQAVEQCQDYNYLDDQRYALERAKALFRSGRGVGHKVLLDLRRRGIDETTASQALAEVSREFETAALLREQLQRRFPDFSYASADERQRRRVISYFQRRGFLLGEIFQVIKQKQE